MNSVNFVRSSQNFIKSKKGKPLLTVDGFIYHQERQTSLFIIWKCSEYKRQRCIGREKTCNEQFILTQVHSHWPDICKVHGKKVVSEIKNSAIHQLHSSNQQLISMATKNVTPPVIASLPSIQSISSSFQRVRFINNIPMPIPENSFELVIPENLKGNHDNAQFLMIDFNVVGNRFLLFSTQQNFTLVAQCSFWLADGIFKECPAIFQQLYTIHAFVNDQVVPFVYALLPRKTAIIYRNLFNSLKTLKDDLSPTVIMMDYEVTAIRAASLAFPNAEVKGCFFHFTQSFLRHIQSNTEILKRYLIDPDFAFHLKMLVSLAFIPLQHVNDAFNELMRNMFFASNSAILEPSLIYFRNTYIGQINEANINRPPKLSHSFWNVYDSTINDLPRTNNSVEGWHNAFSSFIEASNPNIFSFLQKLKDYQGLNVLIITQILAGSYNPTCRRRYINLAARLRNIALNFNPSDKISFLERISFNIYF